MVDYFGLYDKLVNTSYSNMPKWMRVETVYNLFKVYDNIWRPVLQELYPRTAAPAANGQPVAVDTPFLIPNVADPQTMSRFYDYLEMPDHRQVAFGKEEMQARMAKEWGPTFNPLEYANEWRTGFLEKRNQMLVSNAVRSLERLVEYELVQYSRGDQTHMANYGNQYDKQSGRMKKFDCGESSTSGTTYLNGKQWDASGCNPMDDIVKMQLYFNEMAGEDFTMGFIGPSTAAALEKNQTIYDIVKYHYDATQKPIATSIKGITLKKVIGQTYKDLSSNSAKLGYPGLGDIRADDWTTRKKIKMMTHAVSGTTYEFGIFAAGPVGNTYMAKCHPEHKDVTVPFANEWDDNRTKWKFSEMALGFCPYVYDFSRIMIVDRMAEALV